MQLQDKTLRSGVRKQFSKSIHHLKNQNKEAIIAKATADLDKLITRHLKPKVDEGSAMARSKANEAYTKWGSKVNKHFSI